MRIAICFLTTIDEPKKFNLASLEAARSFANKHYIDIYTYKDNDVDKIEYVDQHTILFSYKELKKQFNYDHSFMNTGSGTKNKSGMQIFPFLHMYLNHKDEYDMFMFWEDDVSLFDIEFFNKLDIENIDVIFQSIRLMLDEWWWKRPELYYLNDKTLQIYSGLLNIWGAKGNVLNDLVEFIKEGNYGHHELIVNTFIMNKYKSVKFYYIDDYFKSIFQLEQFEIKDKDYILVHPIKDIEKYIKYNKYRRQ